MSLSDKEIIEFLFTYGHLRYPFGKEQDLPANRNILTLKDAAVIEAVRSHQSLDVNYAWLAIGKHHRPLNIDGNVGPVTREMMVMPRCGAIDYSALMPDEEEAIGSGSWKGCHGIGDFHAAKIKVKNSPPTFLDPLWDTVKKRMIAAYEEIGLRWIFTDSGNDFQTELTFVDDSDSWIGLAIVPNSALTCNSGSIWLKLLATYEGGNTSEQITTQWCTLLMHETLHNCGSGHTRGGVLNPSIIHSLPNTWIGDTSEAFVKRRFGGVPVPGSIPPDPTPNPPGGELVRFTLAGKKYLIIPDPGYLGM